MALVPGHLAQLNRALDQLDLYGELRRLVFNQAVEAVRHGSNQAIGAVVRSAARRVTSGRLVSGNTQSRIEQRLGVTKSVIQNSDNINTPSRPPKRQKVEPTLVEMYAEGSSYNQKALIKRTVRVQGLHQLEKSQVEKAVVGSKLQRVVERWSNCQAVKRDDTPQALQGSQILNWGPSTDIAGVTPNQSQSFAVPMYFFDISAAYNNNALNSTLTYPNVCYRPELTWNETGNDTISFFNWAGRNPDDSLGLTTWRLGEISTNAQSGLDVVGSKTFMEYLDVDMSIFGARKVPGCVYVELWRFTDPALCLPYTASSTNNTNTATSYKDVTDGDDIFKRTTFFKNWINKMCGIMTNFRQLKGSLDGVEIHRIQKLEFNPTSTTESDANGHQKDLRLHIPLNKLFKYDWYFPANDEPQLNELGNPDEYDTKSGNSCQLPAPRETSRMFLVVRADVPQMHATKYLYTTMNPVDASHFPATATLYDMFPSFDILIQRKRSQIKI